MPRETLHQAQDINEDHRSSQEELFEEANGRGPMLRR
jgi:hypothetical protein